MLIFQKVLAIYLEMKNFDWFYDDQVSTSFEHLKCPDAVHR